MIEELMWFARGVEYLEQRGLVVGTLFDLSKTNWKRIAEGGRLADEVDGADHRHGNKWLAASSTTTKEKFNRRMTMRRNLVFTLTVELDYIVGL